MKIETVCVHGDDDDGDDDDGKECDVAPAIHVATTFDVSRWDDSIPVDSNAASDDNGKKEKEKKEKKKEKPFAYSRDDQPNRRKLETVLAAIEGGGYCVSFASGLSATYCCLKALAPKRLILNHGYHGTRQVADLLQADGVVIIYIDTKSFTSGKLDDAFIQRGDVIFLETPTNPDLDIYDIAEFSERVKKVGASLVIDSTLASPILQKPLALGADAVMHSATKYIGGHSDTLSGVIITRSKSLYDKMISQRFAFGAVTGALETWLLLRSVKTLPMRVMCQSLNATALAKFLDESMRNTIHGKAILSAVIHPSLPSHPQHEIAKRQMTSGHVPVVTIKTLTSSQCIRLPRHLKYFKEATSLGGVESLIDRRSRWDKTTASTLLRISVGIENMNDLINDFDNALKNLYHDDNRSKI